MRILVTEKQAKQIVVKSDIPRIDYVINPYVGCQHACAYCYADFMRRWTGHQCDRWGEFVDVKVNAPAVFKSRDWRGQKILLSSVTDAYQPIERKYRLTRSLLQRIAASKHQPTVEIITKSNLVSCDLDVLKALENVQVGFSFSTADEPVRRIVEPGAATIERRLEALRQIHQAGLRTFVFIAPILPYVTAIEALIQQTQPYVDFFMHDKFNMRPSLWPRLRAALRQLDPALVSRYEQLFFKGGECAYWEEVLGRTKSLLGE